MKKMNTKKALLIIQLTGFFLCIIAYIKDQHIAWVTTAMLLFLQILDTAGIYKKIAGKQDE